MKNLTVKIRLVIMVLIFLAFFAISFIISITNMSKMMRNSDSIYTVRLHGIQNLVEADRDAYQSNLAINHLLLKKDLSESERDQLIDDVESNLKQVSERYSIFLAAFQNSTSKQHIDLEDTFSKGIAELESLTRDLVSLIKNNNTEEAYNVYTNKYSSVFEEVRDVLDRFTNYSSVDAENEYNNIKETQNRSRTTLVSIFLLLLISVTIISFYFIRSITAPLDRGIEFAHQIASGNLNATIENISGDEIGTLNKSLLNMSDKLRGTINNIIVGAENIARASVQISSTSQHLSQGASEQASSVEEVSSTMEQIAANIEQNTDNSRQTEQISTDAEAGITNVSNQSKKVNEANITIAEKIKIINDIAFQTNILALNAAVEAARAGEHGKGFAVVASEVRKLAERSKIAADDIVSLVEKSLKMSEEAGATMEETLPLVIKTKSLVQEITSASMEQNNGASQVNNAMLQLNNVTQQNASSSEELATNAEELASQAEQLREEVSYFKLSGGGQQTGFGTVSLVTTEGGNNQEADKLDF